MSNSSHSPKGAPENGSPGEGLPEVSPDVVEQESGGEAEEELLSPDPNLPPIVALGGSAGSMRALQEFFTIMPPDSGMAFVVIVHLSPDHESTLAAILQHCTTMPVNEVNGSTGLEKNHVYIIPPAKNLTLENSQLCLSDQPPRKGRHVAVDMFFRTLADGHASHAAAVVLSGADGDGALGIKRIKERGGLTIAQDLSEAEHNSMPQSAVKTGMVDWVLPVAEMPARIIQYWESEQKIHLPPEEGPQPVAETGADAQKKPLENGEAALRDILTFLKVRTGRDFAYYKRATILRRISRRMQVNGLADPAGYMNLLRTQPGEPGALLQDLLISVTNFFRDREAFDGLETLIPKLFAEKGPGDCVRVWVAACATGEEAYSIAMMLAEYAASLDSPPSFQVFATDLDESAVHYGRAALYPADVTADVSEDRLRRFFSKVSGGYRVKRELRETVLFAVHDLLKDSPFSRLDLVSCRNLLIYLNKAAQAEAAQIFHFALHHGGTLFLGVSDSIDEGNKLFATLHKRYRLYASRASARQTLPVPRGPTSLTLAARRDAAGRPSAARAGVREGSNIGASGALPDDKDLRSERLTWGERHFQLLERFGPPSLVVNGESDIVHLSENAGRFLQLAGGEPTTNLLKMAPPPLRGNLRAALFRARQTGEAVQASDIPLEIGGVPRSVTLHVMPEEVLGPDLFLVVFEEKDGGLDRTAISGAAREPLVEHLEHELDQVKRELRDTVEQSEAASEELKASNEELQAINEELRSATEELETSREELQSINEELTTVNAELKGKIEELGRSNNDLQNLMASTAIATIFLTREFRIGRFTAPAVTLFNLIESDVGRPLSDITHHLDYPNLGEHAARVLETLAPIEHEVAHSDGRWFLARILPYRTAEDQIGGVVMTFVDITRRKIAEGALRASVDDYRRSQTALEASEERLRLVVENAREFAIFSMDLDRRIVSWNRGAENLLGYSEDEIVGKPADLIFTGEDRAAGAPEKEAVLALRDGRAGDERWHLRKDGSRFWASGAMMAMHGANGKTVGLVKILRDETSAQKNRLALERSRQEMMSALAAAELAKAEAEAAGQAKDRFLAMLSHELRTPLTPVLMGVRLLQLNEDLPEDDAEALEMIARNVQLEARFIDDLLDISRLSHGKLEITREPLDIHEVIRAATQISRPEIDDKKQTIQLLLNAKKHRCLGDAVRLQQVIWNLVKNAAKFSPEHAKIRVRTSDGKRVAILEFIDSGVGIQPEGLNRIFDAFAQEKRSSPRGTGGLGLGLAIAKAVVEAHGGEIKADSAGLDQGATFTVTLPVED